jgi:hypothetical protein
VLAVRASRERPRPFDLRRAVITITSFFDEGVSVMSQQGQLIRQKRTAYGRVTAIPGGARLTMGMKLRPRGLPTFALPLLARYMHRQQERKLATIKALLER